MIGPKILDEIKQTIGKLLDEHLDLIDQAYVKADSGLTISIPIKLEPSERPGFQVVQLSINFVAHRVKKKVRKILSEGQDALFKEKGISSVTLSNGEKSVTLTSKTRGKIKSVLEKEGV